MLLPSAFGPQLLFVLDTASMLYVPLLPIPYVCCTSFHLESCLSMVSVPLYSTENRSPLPAFFVVMRITPWLARLP